MRLTHICPRFKEIHGGGEPVLLNLLHELCGLGVENTVHTFNFPPALRPLLDSRVRLKGLPKFFDKTFNNVLLAGFYDLFCGCFLAANISKDVDAVCFYTEAVVPALFFYKLFGGRKPSLYFCFQPPRFAYDTTKETARSSSFLGGLVPVFKSIYKPFDRAAVRRADKISTFSMGYKKWIESIYNVKEVSVLPPGVDKPEKLKELPDAVKLKLPESSKVVLSVGKLVTWKNIDRLINIIDKTRGDVPEVRLLIVGDGPCRPQLEAQVKELGLGDYIIFCGYVPSEDVFSYCAVSDILVLLEKNASFGLSLIEANAVGLPVAALEGGGPSDVVSHGKNGYLLPENTLDKEIVVLLTNHFKSVERCEQMKKHALSIASEYSWSRFAEMFVASIQSMIAENG